MSDTFSCPAALAAAKSAKYTMTYAAIGLVIVIAAYAIASLLFSTLGAAFNQ